MKKFFSPVLLGTTLAIAALAMASNHLKAIPTKPAVTAMSSCPECGPVPLCPPDQPNCPLQQP